MVELLRYISTILAIEHLTDFINIPAIESADNIIKSVSPYLKTDPKLSRLIALKLSKSRETVSITIATVQKSLESVIAELDLSLKLD